jgi:hypothetical protein
MATLSTQDLQIDNLSGSWIKDELTGSWRPAQWNEVRLTATVNIELNDAEFTNHRYLGVNYIVQSSVWGIDGNLLNGNNDNLFYFRDQQLTREGTGTYTFSKVITRDVLNEDHSWFNKDDEISASFSLVSFNQFAPLNVSIMTPIYRGYF